MCGIRWVVMRVMVFKSKIWQLVSQPAMRHKHLAFFFFLFFSFLDSPYTSWVALCLVLSQDVRHAEAAGEWVLGWEVTGFSFSARWCVGISRKVHGQYQQHAQGCAQRSQWWGSGGISMSRGFQRGTVRVLLAQILNANEGISRKTTMTPLAQTFEVNTHNSSKLSTL